LKKYDNSVAVLGGTFNPIHKGHLAMAITCHKEFGINKILIMPSADPSSYKDSNMVLPKEDRAAMVKLAIEDYDYLEFSDLELKREGRTYTADTLSELLKTYSHVDFIIGADSLFYLDKWYHADYVLKNCRFIAANRDQHSSADLKARIDFLEREFGAQIELMHMDCIDVSSTQVRDMVHENKDISDLVDEKVKAYIIEKGLYI